MKLAILVGIGGFLGSVSRYILNTIILKYWSSPFPLGTFSINIAGSLFLGIIYAIAEEQKILSHEARLLFAVGFCGSFTTFSTFSMEMLNLLQSKDWLTFGLYSMGSIIMGIIAVAAGYFITSKMI